MGNFIGNSTLGYSNFKSISNGSNSTYMCALLINYAIISASLSILYFGYSDKFSDAMPSMIPVVYLLNYPLANNVMLAFLIALLIF